VLVPVEVLQQTVSARVVVQEPHTQGVEVVLVMGVAASDEVVEEEEAALTGWAARAFRRICLVQRAIVLGREIDDIGPMLQF
jgi:hypothetical protein